MGRPQLPSARRATSPLAEERGITIIEVTMAVLVLIVGALGLLAMVDTATRTTFRAEQSQVVVNRLQGELERIRQLPFSEVALTAQPQASDDPDLPTDRVAGTQFALDRSGTDLKPMVFNGGTLPGGGAVSAGDINPGPEDFDEGDVSGRIYRFVVAPGAPANCNGCSADDLKRVIIAAVLDDTASGGERVYQEIQSDVANPDVTPSEGNTLPPGGGTDDELATFWLTDTPCSQSARQPLAGNHQTHNTRGKCSDGMQTGNARGAPDLMFNEQPPESDAGSGTLYDYATDVEPAQNPGADIGLTVRRPQLSSSNGCLLSAPLLSQLEFPVLNAESDKQQKMHMWLSSPLESSFRVLSGMDATLKLWTKSINGASYPGRICVWVFKRVTALSLLGAEITVDVPATNANGSVLYFTFSRSTWPQEWTEITVPMEMTWAADALSGLNIVGQPRLGVAMTVERANTGSDGIEFMYDHPNFESRLAVQSEECILLC